MYLILCKAFLISVPSFTFIKVGDTDLHYPYKMAIKKAFYLWYSTCVTELNNRKEKSEITLEEYQLSISNLLSIGVLRDKAPVWASKGIEAITKPRSRVEEGESQSAVDCVV